jgi:hypothetical protein
VVFVEVLFVWSVCAPDQHTRHEFVSGGLLLDTVAEKEKRLAAALQILFAVLVSSSCRLRLLLTAPAEQI